MKWTSGDDARINNGYDECGGMNTDEAEGKWVDEVGSKEKDADRTTDRTRRRDSACNNRDCQSKLEKTSTVLPDPIEFSTSPTVFL